MRNVAKCSMESITNFEQNIEMDYTGVGYDRFYCFFLLAKHCPFNDKAFSLWTHTEKLKKNKRYPLQPLKKISVNL